MLQVDYIYDFLYSKIFNKDFDLYHFYNGVLSPKPIKYSDISIFTPGIDTTRKIFFYDQEPLLPNISEDYLDFFYYPQEYTIEQLLELHKTNTFPYGYPQESDANVIEYLITHPNATYKKTRTLVTSEKSQMFDLLAKERNFSQLYYFFHGFAALDWYRGYWALNNDKQVVNNYKYDFISYNRIVSNDRSYRIYLLSQLKEKEILHRGLVSFNVDDQNFNWRDELDNPVSKLSSFAKHHIQEHLLNLPNKLSIDKEQLPGSSSARIPKQTHDGFWHLVTETVFYYDKLHLTEKIFKPIVSKQPFMLLAAPGNLNYLRSYGFKTFDGIIDENYDTIQDSDERIASIVQQLEWYSNLSSSRKQQVMEKLAPIVEYNFQYFYNDFKHTLSRELLDNIKNLFRSIGHDDAHIDYSSLYSMLTH